MPKILHQQEYKDGQNMGMLIFRVVELDNKDLVLEKSESKDAIGNPVWVREQYSYVSQYATKLAKLYRELLDEDGRAHLREAQAIVDKWPEELKTMLGPPPKPVKINKPKLKPYPRWICDDCGDAYCYLGKTIKISTYHPGVCEVCEQRRAVTEPRDWGYPIFPGHKEP